MPRSPSFALAPLVAVALGWALVGVAGCGVSSSVAGDAGADLAGPGADVPPDLSMVAWGDLLLSAAPTYTLTFTLDAVVPGFESFPMVTQAVGNATTEYIWKLSYSSSVPPHHVVFDAPQGAASGYDPLYSPAVLSGSSTQEFPPGHALVLPANADVQVGAHYVNASMKVETPTLTLLLYTLPHGAPPTVPLYLATMQDNDINLPPLQPTDVGATCPVPEDIDLYSMMSHQHGLGVGIDAVVVGGPLDGKSLYHSTTWDNAPVLTFDPPVHLAKGVGIRWTCHYVNTTTMPVRFGLSATNEMCGVAGYVGGAARAFNLLGDHTGACVSSSP